MTTDRRRFVKMLGAGALASAFPQSIKRALAIPAHHRTGSIEDVEHIVILMQENRSFDHYFGTLRGVRGFGDPRAVRLASGAPVWNQLDPETGSPVLPFRPNVPDMGLAFLEDTAHNWRDTILAWNNGKYDQWIPNKGTTSMAHLNRKDIPFHFALADAFTICDAYHCSFMGATDPNRYHLWTGWIGNDGKNGGPVLDNSEAGYDWSTYPERLQKAGISWKVYQDAGQGLDQAHYWGWGPAYVGNYGDNSLLYFHQYQNAAEGSPLASRARTGTDISKGGTLFDQFKADVAANRLPSVTWVVAPEAYSEHPNWPANYGAWYVSQILDALTANPEVWSKTAFFLNYDENDGFFDHMVPPTPPTSRAQGLSTVDASLEIFNGNAEHAETGPFGLGVRVPMLVISPWSKGGWVNSEVFDHTSLIQFIEQRFANRHNDLIETNITPWRRAVAGDLTSAFDFKSPNSSRVRLPSTTSYAPPDNDYHADFSPTVPAQQSLSKQERGVRPARAVPYDLDVAADIDVSDGKVKLRFGNSGKAAAVFQVRSGNTQDGPWTYTVSPRAHVDETWAFRAKNQKQYDLSVYGPNGFFRSFKGSITGVDAANLSVDADFKFDGGITLDIENQSRQPARLRIYDAYGKRTVERTAAPHQHVIWHFDTEDSFGWYDLTIEVVGDSSFEQQLAGHVETGCDSMSDPLLGA
ncbi:MAG: phospholipase C, phosphocholine-specific [Polyangiaceae bacterium]